MNNQTSPFVTINSNSEPTYEPDENPLQTVLNDSNVSTISYNGSDSIYITHDSYETPLELTQQIPQSTAKQFIMSLTPDDNSIDINPITTFYTQTHHATITCTFHNSFTFTIRKHNHTQPIHQFIESQDFSLKQTAAILHEIEQNGTLFVFGQTQDPTIETISALTHLTPAHNITSTLPQIPTTTIPSTQQTLEITRHTPNHTNKTHPQILFIHTNSLQDALQQTNSQTGLYIDCTTTPHNIHQHKK